MLRGQGLPRWSKLEGVVRQLAAWHNPFRDPDEEAARFLHLWQAASGSVSAPSQSAQNWNTEVGNIDFSDDKRNKTTSSQNVHQGPSAQINGADGKPSAGGLPYGDQQDFRPIGWPPKWTFEDQADTAAIGRVIFDPNSETIVPLLDSIGRSSKSVPSIQGHENEESAEQGGALTIRNLMARCLETDFDEQATVLISHVVGGGSGACVLRVDLIRSGDPRQSFILKFGLDKIALERARWANSEAQKVLGQDAIVSFIGEIQTDASGYHAVVTRVANGSAALADWLLYAATSGEAARVADALFIDLLHPLFGRDGRRSVEASKWLSLSVADIMRARETLTRYEPVLSDGRVGKVWRGAVEFKGLRALLEGDGYSLRLTKIWPDTVQFVRGFGNLHSRNVLVQGTVQPRPVLVDASLYGFHHWASDSARLIVDLFLRARRPGVESMLWSDLEESVGAGERLCPHSCEGPAKDDRAVDAFIATGVRRASIFTNALELGILSSDWHWQWHTAIAREFLRQSSHADLTPPRAALALILAARHLRRSLVLLRRAG